MQCLALLWAYWGIWKAEPPGLFRARGHLKPKADFLERGALHGVTELLLQGWNF